MNSLWINVAGDVYEMRLANGRASGPTAVEMSKRFAAEDAGAARNGNSDNWNMEMSIHSDNGPMSEIQMGGFSKMRAYLLSACKS